MVCCIHLLHAAASDTEKFNFKSFKLLLHCLKENIQVIFLIELSTLRLENHVKQLLSFFSIQQESGSEKIILLSPLFSPQNFYLAILNQLQQIYWGK